MASSSLQSQCGTAGSEAIGEDWFYVGVVVAMAIAWPAGELFYEKTS
jgi:hypothetical protein